ncbi:MAG TPA: hypothetical protein VHB49_08570 [Bradyrhizobium sp.]|nr:hypothetical protein [Bradyrhizobium sp.]
MISIRTTKAIGSVGCQELISYRQETHAVASPNTESAMMHPPAQDAKGAPYPEFSCFVFFSQWFDPSVTAH